MPDEPEELLDLVLTLPAADVHRLATAAGAGQDSVARLGADAGSLVLRQACGLVSVAIVERGAAVVAGWLEGVVAGAGAVRRDQQVEIVWTGPDSDMDTARLTSQVVVDLIAGAERSVLLCSFATTAEPRIHQAIADALARDVDVTVLYERRADNPAYDSDAATFVGLPVRRLVWPLDRRPRGAALHPKFIVIDEHTALIGSANLTGRALDFNLECGVLVRGGRGPRTISEHIWSLFRGGVLSAVH